MNLQTLGFGKFFEEQEVVVKDNYLIGRVILEHKHSYRVMTESGELFATVSGNFAYHALTRDQFPAVGDYVLVEPMPGENKGIIHHLFKRKSKFSRKVSGSEFGEQIVASNIDIVFLVMSLNADFNARRLERYLVAAWDSGATPVVVLTKADLCPNIDTFLNEIEMITMGIEVIIVSAITGVGLNKLHDILTIGKTACLLGSSGAGKSTLTNALIAEDKMKVSGIREEDAKGRHTTTHRELVFLPTGACLIDTPGMRELQLWNQEDSLDTAFSDIESLAGTCRFRDCTHKKEPGCAILKAIEMGQLEESRLRSYFKLQQELAYMKRKTKIDALLAEKRKNKHLSKKKKDFN